MSDTPSKTNADEGTRGALAPVAGAARRHWWLVLLCVLLAGAVASALSAKRAKTYSATAQVLVTPLSDAGSYAGLPVLTNSVDPTRTLQTAASILDSAAVAQGVSRELARATPPVAISAVDVGDSVTVDPLGDSDIVSVVAKRHGPGEATRVADAYARSALTLRAETLRTAVSSSVDDLRRRQGQVPPDSQTASNLSQELTDLQRILDGHDPNFSLLKGAGPAKVTGASPKIILALGLLGGALLGLLGAVGLEFVNRRVLDEEELLELYPLPVLTRVPPMSSSARQASSPESVPIGVREALRTLQVQLDDGASGGRSVMFTSPSSGDGKTTTTINFAYAVAATGAQVILLDLDLRKSDVGSRLGLQADMMDLYRPDVRIEDVLIDVPDVPGLRVLSARAHKGVAPLFEAIIRRIPELIAQARELADYVIVDSAPLGAVSDALRVAGAVDEVLLVVRPGHTDRNDLARARELLERLQHRPLGLVLVGQGRHRSDSNYGYGIAATPTDTHEAYASRRGAPDQDLPLRRG